MRKVKRIFGDKKPNQGLLAIEVVFGSIEEMAKGHLRYSQDLVKYASAVETLIKAWAPTYGDKLGPFIEVYKTLSKLYFALGNDEIRVSEDIRDCYERYFAVDKFAQTYNSISDKYQNASDDVIHAMGDELYEKRMNPDKYELKKEQLQEKIAKAKAQKKLVLGEKKEALKRFIHARETYNTFKVRRLMHAFLLYSKALQETAEKEDELYGKAAGILTSLKEGGDLPEKIVEGIEQSMPSTEESKELNEAAAEVAQQIGEVAAATQEEIESETPKEEEAEQPKEEEPEAQEQPNLVAEDEKVYDASVFAQKDEEKEDVVVDSGNTETEFY